MRKKKQLAAVLALTTLVGASAFADSRHSNETRARGEGRDTIRRSRDAGRAETRRRDETRNESRERNRATVREEARPRSEARSRATVREEARPRSEARSRATVREESRPRTESRSRETYRNDSRSRNESRSRETYRNDSRSRSDSRSRDSRDRSYRNDHSRGRQAYHTRGRVSRVHPYSGGYRVYVHGARYPFFIPHAHYHRDRFRVGLVINLGGYYNSGGYYDYYDGRSSGDLRGVVESVDYRRDTFVVRNDASGSFVTVVMRDRYPDNVRPGDYVEVTGDWTRAGVFRAYDVDRLDVDYRR
ncbi:MAG TPA: hypothetical protein VEK57_25305 [Thermoanaerobaculia bacterium]|nr:hypothetical protein [Thermoanaerobaculia bacterium]